MYTGIFMEETGQQLLNCSIVQLLSTLGVAWEACKTKEKRLDVFTRCMDLVETWNEKTFGEEAQVFSSQPRASECTQEAFRNYVRQMYRSSASVRVRATLPSDAAYVQSMLTCGAKHPAVRSGKFFECDSSLERKDVGMDIVRQALGHLSDEYVFLEEVEGSGDTTPDVGPDDSASQVGIAAHTGRPRGSTLSENMTVPSAPSAPHEAPSVAPSVSAKHQAKSVTVVTRT